MSSSPSIARSFYRWIAIAALPGTMWSAFELYVLTLGGAQMLFFSIVHTMPLLVVAVLIGVIALALWLIQSVIALFLRAYRRKVAVPTVALASFTTIAAGHLSLLFSYDYWSVGSLRTAACLVGILGIATLLVQFVRYVWKEGIANVHA